MDQLNLTTANFMNNSTSGHSPPSFSLEPSALVLTVLLSLCFLMGVPGNLAVIILKPNWQNLSKQTQYLMVNLALSDLLCLGTLPFWIYTRLFSWTLGTVTCKIVGFLAQCSIYSSVLTVTALSVQRYMQVIQHRRYLTFKKKLLALLWVTSMALSIPALVLRQAVRDQTFICHIKYTSSAQQVAVLFTECFVGFSSFIIMTSAYIFLNRKLNQAVLFNNASTSRLVNSIIVTFFVLWMPYVFFQLVSAVGILNKNVKIINFHDVGFNILVLVTVINSCINPLLYAFAIGISRQMLYVNE
uniref:G-protein coupled receptors family 1 profile domain-containing protein n=1 Tax=Neogobius melanostomus TaxID=47308 RepID=A0A8C6WJY1_9GOBI